MHIHIIRLNRYIAGVQKIPYPYHDCVLYWYHCISTAIFLIVASYSLIGCMILLENLDLCSYLQLLVS